jgi:hypothetical protein
LGACLADRALRLPAEARWGLLFVGALVVAAAFARLALRALRRMPWTEAAAQVERRTGAFGQRLQTMVSQLALPVEQRGSRQMLDVVCAEVEAIVPRGGAAGRLLPWRLAAVPWLVAAGIGLGIAALWPLPSLDAPRLAARLLHPGRKIDPVTTTRLLVSPEGREVLPGESLIVSARVEGPRSTASVAAARGVDLYLSTDGSTWSRAAMNPVSLGESSSRFEFPLPAIGRDLLYYVRGGDARSDTYRLRVKHVPAATEFRIRYTYPAYANHLPVSVTNTDGLIESLVGSDAELTVVASEPLASAEFWVGGQALPLAPTTRPTEWQVKLSVQQNATCALEMTSEAGVTGHGPTPMLLRALADREPAVVIEQPSRDLRLAADDAALLRYAASDDYGLRSLSAVVKLNGAPVVAFPVAAPAKALRAEGEMTLELSDLSPKVGDVVSVVLRAEDYAGHVKASDERLVLVAPASVGVKAYARVAELRRAARLAKAWTQSLGRARDAVNAARAADPRSAKQDVWTAANHALAAAGENAASLRQALMRALVRSESAEFSLAVGALVDETVAPAIDPGRVLTPAISRSESALPERLSRISDRSVELGRSLGVLLAGEAGSLARAELANVKAVAAIRPPSPVGAALRTKAVDDARRTIEEVLRELAITGGSGGAGVDEQLRQRAEAEQRLVKGQRPVDFAAAAAVWQQRLRQPGGTGAELVGRLGVAAQVEACRPSGDVILARDLELASRAAAAVAQSVAAARDADRGAKGAAASDAARAKLFEPLGLYETALLQLLRQRGDPGALEAARAKMQKWSGGVPGGGGDDPQAEPAEQLVLEASAAASLRDYPLADKLDGRLAEQVQRASQDEAARFAQEVGRAMREARTLDELWGRQEKLLAALEAGLTASEAAANEQAEVAAALEGLSRSHDAAVGRPSPEPEAPALFAGEVPSRAWAVRRPLAAAATRARAAADALRTAAVGDEGAGGDARSAALAAQKDTVTWMRTACDRAARRAIHRRLEEIPSMSSLFQPFAPDDPPSLVGAWPRYGTRFREGFRPGEGPAAAGAAAAQHEVEPAGYGDQLKAYFDALTRAQQGRR